MTWYANNLYLPASDQVLRTLSSHEILKPFLYVVRDLKNFEWFTPEVKHSIGLAGLAVVRPIYDQMGHAAEWYGKPILSWQLLQPSQASVRIENYREEVELSPPASLLQFLAELSESTKSPVMYYASSMWGGDIESEASWVFNPKLLFYETEVKDSQAIVRCFSDQGCTDAMPGNALNQGLTHLGIELPTAYFALHTRSFPWERYRFVQ